MTSTCTAPPDITSVIATTSIAPEQLLRYSDITKIQLCLRCRLSLKLCYPRQKGKISV